MATTDKILATYSPESVLVVISNDNFSHVISGYADGTFLSITRVVEHATLYTGADATAARVKRKVRNTDITLTLGAYSESNDVLSHLLYLDEEADRDEHLFAITIKDASGRTLASSPQAFIGTTPDISFGTDMAENDWMIHAVGMDIISGGNGKFTAATWDTLADLGSDQDPYWNTNVQQGV